MFSTTPSKVRKKNPHPDSGPRLIFGVEFELPLAKQSDETGIELSGLTVARNIEKDLAEPPGNPVKSGVDTVWSRDMRTAPLGWDIWHIGKDETVCPPDSGRDAYIYDFEVKSRVFREGDRQWEKEVSKVFETLNPLLSLSPKCWIFCTTHVHISVDGHRHFPVAEAKRIGFAAIYFERAIDSRMPAPQNNAALPGGWKNNEFAKGIAVNRGFRSFRKTWESIAGMADIWALSDALCPHNGNRADRCWKWNFRGYGTTTIKYRQPPPCTGSQDAQDWVSFTLAFARAAMSIDPRALDKAAKKVGSQGKHEKDEKYRARDEKAFASALGLKERPYKASGLMPFLARVQRDVSFVDRLDVRRSKLNSWLKDQPRVLEPPSTAAMEARGFAYRPGPSQVPIAYRPSVPTTATGSYGTTTPFQIRDFAHTSTPHQGVPYSTMYGPVATSGPPRTPAYDVSVQNFSYTAPPAHYTPDDDDDIYD
ncbi:hypothetical protein F4778DRAFT_791615 [Xylariomycetidae sp. FL2044]|nr:hypothetical protein F4778DRAFT_791615 [Xylariomycetidae sp. FL2044]